MIYGWRQPGPKNDAQAPVSDRHIPFRSFPEYLRRRSGDPVAGNPPYSRFTFYRSCRHITEPPTAKLHTRNGATGQGHARKRRKPLSGLCFKRVRKFYKKRANFRRKKTAVRSNREKIDRTGTNAQQVGNQKYRAPARQSTTRIRKETNKKCSDS